MNWDELDALWDRFTSTVFRLETLQDYTPEEPEKVAAFLQGEPRRERSVRTSPWLARIAVTTATQGKHWQRVRVVEEPLSSYTQYEMLSYVESQAAGEEIRIVRRAGIPPTALRGDFWLFDYDTPDPFALRMDYSSDGRLLDAGLETDPQALAVFDTRRKIALQWSVPLNEYLAGTAEQAA